MSRTTSPSALVVDDEAGHRAMLKTVLRGWGYRVEEAEDGRGAVAMVREQPFDVVLMDVRMAGMGGIEALKAIKRHNPAIPVIIMTAFSALDTAIEAMKAGAYDYLTKPLDYEVLRMAIERALEHAGLKEENRELRRKISLSLGPDSIIGSSEPMRKLMDMASMVAASEATVLITGESGTGKELIARAIHFNSGRKNGPLVTVNCAALSENLLESELFGHEKGAFTGADRRREGRFMQADGGTIFLDEIGEISLQMQVKLLRVIQQREIQRVGGDHPLTVDVRVVAATNRDLGAEVEAGRFREDLYYRLNVVTLTTPPLRERPEDVPLLAAHFLKRFAERNRKTVKGFSPQAMDLMVRHGWPGNVRELENAVERAVVLMAGEYVGERELPLGLSRSFQEDDDSRAGLGNIPLEELERQAILATLKAAEGNKSEAARRLGVTRKTLHAKLQKIEAEHGDGIDRNA